MRVMPAIWLNAFKDPEERAQIKVMQDLLRQVTGALAHSLQPGQAPLAKAEIPVIEVQTSPLLDGTVHTDTVAQSVSRGSLIYGNSTPKWDELVIGTANKFLRTDGTDPSWQAIVEGDITDGSILARVGADETITGKWIIGPAGGSGAQDLTIGVATSGGGGGGLFLDDGSGFLGNIISTPSTGLTASRTYVLPDADGTFVLGNVSATLLGDINSVFKTNTASNGASFSDNTTASKRLRVVLSGAVGNNNIVVSSTAARTYTTQDDNSTIPAIVAVSGATNDKTGQTASLAAYTAYTTTHAGQYLITAYAVFTAVTTPGNLTFKATWTDAQGAHTSIPFGNESVNGVIGVAYAAAGDTIEGTKVVQCTSGTTIKPETVLTGVGTYNVHFRVTALT